MEDITEVDQDTVEAAHEEVVEKIQTDTEITREASLLRTSDHM